MFKITIDLPEQRVASLLCTAIEGGINYWCEGITKAWEGPAGKRPVPYLEDGEGRTYAADYPLTPGGVLCVKELDGDTHRLDRAAVIRGLALMGEHHARHFGDFMDENEDATTGDVFVQLCLFGELRYG